MVAKTKRKKNLLDEMAQEMKVVNVQKQPEENNGPVKKEVKTKSIKNVPWYPPNDKVKKELKQLALDEETSMSKLITEGIELLFKTRGKSVTSFTEK